MGEGRSAVGPVIGPNMAQCSGPFSCWGSIVVTRLDEVVLLESVRTLSLRCAFRPGFLRLQPEWFTPCLMTPWRVAATILYAAILADCFRLGEVYVTSDVVGAACWLPPEFAVSTLPRQIRSGMLALPLRFGLGGFFRLVADD